MMRLDAVLLLCRATMTEGVLKYKALIGAYLQFQWLSPFSSWCGASSKQAGRHGAGAVAESSS